MTHHPSPNTDWQRRFEQALLQAETRAEEARAEHRLFACGFSSNVDRVATLDRVLLDRLYGGRIVDGSGPRIMEAASVDELLIGIAQCVAAGDGADLVSRDPAVQEWLLQRMHGRQQIGGTGVQAGSTLAALGFPVIVHLTGRSPEQIAALAHRELIWVGSPDGLQPVDEAIDPNDATMWHPVLEFAEGLRAPLPGWPAAPAANRILFGYDPVNAAFTIDPGFSAALAEPGVAIGALLVSGFSQLHDGPTRGRVLGDAVVALQGWRAARPELFIHLELGAMPDFAGVAQAVAALQPMVSSIGMNIDELRDLLAVHGVTMAAPGPDLVRQLRELRERYPAPRLSVHTREFCLTLTDNDPARERHALLFASLVAATRSRIARFPEMTDLQATLRAAEVNPAGLELLRALGLGSDGSQADDVVATPGLCFAGPPATVGLGDSFTGGLLAML